jgi:hypothetical protein
MEDDRGMDPKRAIKELSMCASAYTPSCHIPGVWLSA